MAVDTAAKRHAALLWGLPFRTPPRPDGTTSAADRAAAVFLYGGLVSSSSATAEFYRPRSTDVADALLLSTEQADVLLNATTELGTLLGGADEQVG